MEFIGTTFTYIFIGCAIVYFIRKHQYKKGDRTTSFPKYKNKLLVAMIVSLLIGGIIGAISENDSKPAKKSSVHKVAKTNWKKLNREYPDLYNVFPNGGNTNQNDLKYQKVKFTGKVSGMFRSVGNDIILMKSKDGKYAYTTIDENKFRRIILYNVFTVYGTASNIAELQPSEVFKMSLTHKRFDHTKYINIDPDYVHVIGNDYSGDM